MKEITFLLTACLLMVGCATTPPPPPPKPLVVEPYRCPAISGTIVVDGWLDEPDWQSAEALPINLVYKGKANAVPPPEGSVRLVWNEDALYVGFSVSDDDIWSFSDQADEHLWNGDVVELFVKPSREAHAYCEFVIAPNGAFYDACYTSRGAAGVPRFSGWSSGASIATVREVSDVDGEVCDRGYTVEMAIPWSAFPAERLPPVGLTWTFGAFRYDYSKSYETPYLLMSVPARSYGFHTYEVYRDIVFK